LKMGPIGPPRTSVINNRSTLPNVAGQRKAQSLSLFWNPKFPFFSRSACAPVFALYPFLQ